MIDDVSDISGHYDADPHQEETRLEHQQLEHELTLRYLREYLPPQGSILDIGAAAGKYTLAVAARGYHVTAVDLSPALIERCRQHVVAEGLEDTVQCLVADARDLSAVTDADFDAVLMMGPLYHLVIEKDRIAALEQAYRRLRPGGMILSSLLSRFGVIGDLLKRIPHWIEDDATVQSLLRHGCRPTNYPRGGFRGYFARVAEVAPLHEKVGFDTVAVAGVEPAISADDESFNRLSGRQREQWLELLYTISREPEILGASRHLLYVGQKPASG